MKKNKESNKNTNKYLKIGLISFILIFLIGLIIYARNFRNFSNISLMTNKKSYYNMTDLVAGDIKYLDNEKRVETVLGKPKKEEKKIIGSYFYKIKKYDGITVTMKEDYNDYRVVKVEITSRKYKTGRNIKVGNLITKVFKKYSVKKKNGSYLYGNYRKEALLDQAVTKEIFYGYRDKEKVEYVVREEIVDKDAPTLTSRITFDYKYGKIKKITWSYDVE